MRTYIGKACKHCGNKVRYESNRTCISCTRKKQSSWRKANPEEHVKQQTQYQKRKLIKRATPPWADMAEIEWLYRECDRLSHQMGIPMVIAHEIPLRGKNVCGLHVHYNMKVVSKSWINTRQNFSSSPRRFR